MNDSSRLSRRGMLVGVGAAGGAVLMGSAPAHAAPAPAHAQIANSVPVGISTISSAPQPGVTYRFAMWSDFTAEDNILHGRLFGGGGQYTAASQDFLAATLDIPPGATLYDTEWYVSNTSGSSVSGYTVVWGSGAAGLSAYPLVLPIPSGAGLRAVRGPVPATSNGPFPHGTKLLCSMSTPTDGSVQINGVRVGFKNAPLSTTMVAPTRVYSSATHDGPLAAGHTRTHSLSARLPAGANGALLSVTVSRTVSSGHLSVHAAGTATPGVASVSWYAANQTLTSQVTTQVSGARAIAVTAVGHATQYAVDLIGYLV